MIQFNLLPDVKQQYIRAARLKRTAIVVSFLITASSLFIFVMLFLSVHVFQKAHSKNLSNDIKTKTEELKKVPDLDKVLTIQNQINGLPKLHEDKPVTSRLFTYLTQLTPAAVNIGDATVDFTAKTITITGTTDSLSSVNKYVDTLKFTTYKDPSIQTTTDPKNDPKPFSSVVLTTFSRTDKEATYSITFTYAPEIFDSKSNITLTVPKITTTRSETEKPTEIFKALPEGFKQ